MVESSWNVMAHGDAREGKWRGNWRREWVASTLHTTSEHGVSSISTADARTSAASSRLNWRPRRFKWTRPFRRRKKPGFCSCAITFQTQSTHSALMCCVRTPEQTATFTSYRINRLVLYNRAWECLLRGTDWVLTLKQKLFVFKMLTLNLDYIYPKKNVKDSKVGQCY